MKLIVFITGFVLSFSALSAERLVELCDTCFHNSNYRAAAISAVASNNPFVGLVQDVYVINSRRNILQYWRVSVTNNGGGNPVAPTSTRNDPKNTSSTRAHISMTADQSSPANVDEYTEMDIVKEGLHFLFWQFKAVDSRDTLGLSIRSSADLIGDDDSIAGFNRILVNNAIRNWTQDLSFQLGNAYSVFARAALDALIDLSIDRGRAIVVEVRFDDESTILVEIDPSGLDEFGNYAFTAEVQTETAQLPNLPGVPQSIGQLGGFGYSGSAESGGALGGLFSRLGASVNFTGSGNNNCAEISCSTEFTNAGSTTTCEVRYGGC